MTEAQKPLPCPFCGGAGSVATDMRSLFVRCKDCGAKGPSDKDCGTHRPLGPHTKAAIITAWDKRADTAQGEKA